MDDLNALAEAIVEAATTATDDDTGDRYVEIYGGDPSLANMFGLAIGKHTTVGFADYILVLGVIDETTLVVGTAPQSRDYYGGPIRMEWSNGWQEKVDDEYIGLEEIAAWIVRAVDY